MKFFNAYKEQFATNLNQNHAGHRKLANAAAERRGGGKLSNEVIDANRLAQIWI